MELRLFVFGAVITHTRPPLPLPLSLSPSRRSAACLSLQLPVLPMHSGKERGVAERNKNAKIRKVEEKRRRRKCDGNDVSCFSSSRNGISGVGRRFAAADVVDETDVRERQAKASRDRYLDRDMSAILDYFRFRVGAENRAETLATLFFAVSTRKRR